MKRIVINDIIDLVWETNKPVIHVAGKPFRQCSFLAVSIPASEATNVDSIDDLAFDQRARSLEGKDAMQALGMTASDVMQAHASNLIAWVENGYDTRILHSNLSFPLLKALAEEGDATAKRVLAGEIRDRVGSMHIGAIIMILDCCARYIDGETWEMLAVNLDYIVRWLVAGNPNTPARTLERLANDAHYIVRWRVSKNPNTPARALERLAVDPDEDVRKTAARKLQAR